MNPALPEIALDRIIASFEADLAAVTDQEIADVLAELRLNPAMKLSSVWVDVLFLLPHLHETSSSEDDAPSDIAAARFPSDIGKEPD